ncbi:MAG: M1 family aminopeptidase, partial [Acidobacteriota bacterium]|nr:M1 family aminopeptidase [Acidobacteriota bacterium]
MLLRFLTLAFVLMITTPIFPQTPAIEAGVPQTLAKWRAANYSDVRYKLNLTLEKMSPTLKGTIEVSLKNNADQIILDWRKIRGKEDLSTVSNVSVNGKAAKFEEINEHLVFKDGVKAGENVVKLDFTSPIATSGAAVTRYVDKEDAAEYVYSLFVPSDASTAFPVFDQPDLKARFKLELIYPKDWKSVSNTQSSGVLLEDNWKTSFQETQPISTYVFAFAAGNFELFRESTANIQDKSYKLKSPSTDKLNQSIAPRRETFIYVRKSQSEKFKQHAAEVFRLNREGVKFLESWFDYKFPFPKYDLVLIPEFPFGGMEHAGATFLREDRVIFPTEPTKNDYITRANVIFHEAAHQWFGDTVTMKWFDDLWLKEGFAEFMAYKTLEKVMPEYNAWKIFYERNKQLAYLTDSTRGTTPIYQEIPNLSAAKSAYGNIVYRKAPSFLRQAEFYLGEDKFQSAVRAFLKK